MYFDIFVSKLDWIFHRIIGQFRLEGTPGGLCSSVLPEARSTMGTHQVAQGFTKPSLENMQGQRHHNLSRQQWKCFLLHVIWISPLSTSHCCLVFPPCTAVKSLGFSPLTPRATSSPKLNKPQFSTLSSQGKWSLTGNHHTGSHPRNSPQFPSLKHWDL